MFVFNPARFIRDIVTFSWRSCKNVLYDRSPLHRACASQDTRTQLTTPKIKHSSPSLYIFSLLSSNQKYMTLRLTSLQTNSPCYVFCFSIQRRILSWDKHDTKTVTSLFPIIDSRPAIAATKSCVCTSGAWSDVTQTGSIGQ